MVPSSVVAISSAATCAFATRRATPSPEPRQAFAPSLPARQCHASSARTKLKRSLADQSLGEVQMPETRSVGATRLTVLSRPRRRGRVEGIDAEKFEVADGAGKCRSTTRCSPSGSSPSIEDRSGAPRPKPRPGDRATPRHDPRECRNPASRADSRDAPGKNRTCARGLGSACSTAQPCGIWELRATVRATTTPSTTSRRWSGRLWRSSIEDELRDLDCRPDRIERLAEGRGY